MKTKNFFSEFLPAGQLIHCTNEEACKDFLHVLNSCEKIALRDAPDGAFLKDNCCYICEHFEFDCFTKAKKGSKFRKDIAHFAKQAKSNPNSYVHGKIHIGGSYENYIANVSNGFARHIKRVPIYKQNLLEKGFANPNNTFKTAFFIEDVSPLTGFCYYDDDENFPSPVTLSYCKEFLNIFKASNVDYIIVKSQYLGETYIWFMDRTQIDFHIKNAINYEAKLCEIPSPFFIYKYIIC